MSRRQLASDGLDDSATRRQRDNGTLVARRRGVYVHSAVAPSRAQELLCAVLSAGDGAVASHLAAAELHALKVPRRLRSDAIEITTSDRRRPRPVGVVAHRTRGLVAGDVVVARQVPATSVARTIVDLTGRLTVEELGTLLDDAVKRRLVTTAAVAATADRLRSARGRSHTRLRSVLRRRVPQFDVDDSLLEDFVIDSLRAYDLPLPLAQHWMVFDGRRRRIDFFYAEERVVIDPKGFWFHRDRSTFDLDAIKANELALAGIARLEVTTAFTDWMIASAVASLLGRPIPERRPVERTFDEWLDRRWR